MNNQKSYLYEEIIKQVEKKLPEQGPLEYFVHHNTIQSYENMNFFDAVKKAAIDFNANAFMSEKFYIHKYGIKKIRHSELLKSVHNFIHINNLDIPSEILLKLLLDITPSEKLPLKQEQYGVFIDTTQSNYYIEKPYFYHQIINENFGVDIDYYSSPIIYRFLSAYFDYGSASWILEDRQKGLWYNFCTLHATTTIFSSKYSKRLSKLVQQFNSMTSIETIHFIINDLDVEKQFKESDVQALILEVCVRHKGWGGFIKSLEHHPEWIKSKEIIPNFVDFVAILLICDYATILMVAGEPPQSPRYQRIPSHSQEFLIHFFTKMTDYKDIKEKLMKVLPFLTDFNRQEIFHRAYENTLYNKFLLACACKEANKIESVYSYQVICCLDDREESFRRYLELNEKCETFGSAGHFGLNISFRGFLDKRFRSLCPVSVEPEFKVIEVVSHLNPVKRKLLWLWGELQWLSAKSSKTLLWGSFQAIISGLFGTIPFMLDVISPRITYKMKNIVSKYFKESFETKLVYKKEENLQIGMDFETRLNLVHSFLTSIGMTENFSPFIFIVGHGSSSLNNPHEAAYDCGACGGGRGAPNSRLMASILNEPEIRIALKSLSINIPSQSIFIGSYHNTCSDEVEFFDTKELENKPDFLNCVDQINEAVLLNARERYRRFQDDSAPKDSLFYLEHVQARSRDLRQTRPEYGHATNALCIIGPRSYSRDLFLDRRAFLISYAPDKDNHARILSEILEASIPVCAGINLEFYFSFVDNEKYGCGTKLPHNINGLVGVINGHMSDLRLGLTWQVVEIHQPIRLLVMIVSQLYLVEELLGQESSFSRLVKNEWINLAVHDPGSNKIWIYEKNKFYEYRATECSKTYVPFDSKILNVKSHVDFGNIADD